MIDLDEVILALKKNKIEFVSGVPDSLFKHLCFKFEKFYKNKHVIAANEGSSIGLAIGYHLASGKIPLVYLQNSGLGNTVNPIISLASSKVYQIPMILFIGWRGEIIKNKKIKDEPQHKEQGFITEKILKTLNIKYKIVNHNSNFKKTFTLLKNQSLKNSRPVALLVRKNTFSNDIIWKVIFVVVFTTFIAYLLNSLALKQLSPTTVSIYIYLQPILAALFAIFWGVDSLDNQKIIAGGLP
mgnify:CR=1 FL=1